MNFTRKTVIMSTVALLTACSASAGEPSEAQMRDAALYAINHPPGVAAGDPISIKFFKKEACEEPTKMGFSCHFNWQVASSNLGASFYNDISMAVFYVDKATGKWAMRPPF